MEEKIIEALGVTPICPLEVSLRTQIPWMEAKSVLERLAREGTIVKDYNRAGKSKPRWNAYRKHTENPGGKKTRS